MARARKKSDGTWYAWSDLHNGGEFEVHKSANGVERRIVTSRNIIERGSEVSESDFEEADWTALVEGGSVREYPLPEEVDEFTSPHRAVMASIVDDNGDIDMNKLMSMGVGSVAALTTLPPPINPPADSENIRTLNDGDDKPAGA